MADLIFAKLEISSREHHLKILKLLSVRVTQTPATRLDHCYSILNDGKLSLFKTTLSDHYGIILTTDIKINKTPTVKTKSWKINSIPLAELRTFLWQENMVFIVNLQNINIKTFYKSFNHISTIRAQKEY